ncbi:MAG: hypothetical protein RL199_986 [Pseudomonadota bacterium]|jgi:bifunctional enzyme CysN/CysC/sulfate adenylyltransferase subunit 1
MGAPQTASRLDVEGWLSQHESKELLRIVTVGSVDDGKSTLIGRLLYDTGSVYEDQLEAIRKASAASGFLDLSFLTDGLAAEREQGITIDVAYRYITTPRRKFIVADTPGHVQYTRNMVTGASTANVALILIDARHGVLEQTRRHAFLASLLGIPHLAVCVNKMDLVGWDQAVFRRIGESFCAFARGLAFREVTLLPVSALTGANVVTRGADAPWYEGPTLLDLLETVPVLADRNQSSFRYPVQTVLRPNLDYRGFAAQVASGSVRVGDELMVLPSRLKTRVKAIDTPQGPRDEAATPESVTLRLADEVDVSRGDMLVHPHDVPAVTQHFDAHLVWLNERPLETGKDYLVKHTTRLVRARVEAVLGRRDLASLDEVPSTGLGLNDIGRVRVTAHRPLFVDPYTDNRATGAFIAIDALTNETVGAGMVLGAVAETAASEEGGRVSPDDWARRLGQLGAVVWFPSSALDAAYGLERRLYDRGLHARVVATPASGAAAEVLRAAGLIALVVSDSEAVEGAWRFEGDLDALARSLELCRWDAWQG